MPIFCIALSSILFSVAAQFLLKMGMSSLTIKQAFMQPLSFKLPWLILSHPFILGGFTLYGLGAIIWLKVLSVWDVSKAYPLVGLGFGFTLLIGIALGENITAFRMLGVLLICQGVWLVTHS